MSCACCRAVSCAMAFWCVRGSAVLKHIHRLWTVAVHVLAWGWASEPRMPSFRMHAGSALHHGATTDQPCVLTVLPSAEFGAAMWEDVTFTRMAACEWCWFAIRTAVGAAARWWCRACGACGGLDRCTLLGHCVGVGATCASSARLSLPTGSVPPFAYGRPYWRGTPRRGQAGVGGRHTKCAIDPKQ